MKYVLVSGGTSTLGKAICKLFIAEGQTVYCAYSSSEQKALELQQELGPLLKPVFLDVRDQTSIDTVASQLTSLDVLVNNSGIFSVYPVEDLSTEEIQRIFDVNVTGLMRMVKSMAPCCKPPRVQSSILPASTPFIPVSAGLPTMMHPKVRWSPIPRAWPANSLRMYG